jgi:DNA-binding response OmpR family regulator
MTRLLMLDFDEHLASAVTRVLSQEGVEVVAVSHVEGARAALGQAFDVALLDCDLLDAAELSLFSQLPVILTTSFLEPEGQHRFFRRARLLRKPFTSAQLLSALHETCGAGSFESTSLVDLLRRANSEGQTLSLSVGRARVFVERGELVHAEFDDASGERALVEVLAQGQHVEVLPLARRAERHSIDKPFQALMLELLEQIEARERDAPSVAARGRDSQRPPRKGSRS